MISRNFPDYRGNSIVNVMASFCGAWGKDSGVYVPHPLLVADKLKQTNSVLLLVIDGLGYEYLTRNQPNSLLHQHLQAKLTSVFPCTTASAITTFLTGLAPQEHGITGWFVYLKELGCVSAILPCRSRMGGHSFGELGADMTQIFNQTPIFNKLDVPCVAIIPDYIADSDYNRIHTGRAELVPYDLRLNHFFDSLRNNITGHEQRRFIYAYWPKLDSLAHLYGIGSDQVSEHFQQLDTFFGDLLNALAGTNSTVIVTSDHGFIDTDPTYRIELSQHPVLANTLILPLCGESRLAYCYVHVNQYQLFEEYINTRFAQSIELAHSRDLLKDGVFGLGRPHPALHNRIGHYVLMMKDRYTIKDWLINEKRYAHVGVHGGVSAEEMFVPLIIAEC